MSKAYLKLLVFSILLFPLWCSNCGPHLKPVERGRYSDPQGQFELTLPHEGWQLISWKDVDLALWDPKEGATIVVNVTPLKEDADLATLTRHLLIAFERKQIISQDNEKVRGREAVKTVLEGWVERSEIKAEVYVVRGEGVLYDIIFWAPRDAFPRKVEQFHQFLLGINFLQPKGPQ
ncbi:MAG: hypothetical protein A2Y65_00665 [Deltaproteobacteria bacterium RBG_13_52_11]|nr:MAG: hypothetical protein A2Y65_00665 [Deltaproteobacteria bacterium RBG_13_52_11]